MEILYFTALAIVVTCVLGLILAAWLGYKEWKQEKMDEWDDEDRNRWA